MLDLQQLRYFVAVADTESIARAAERLHVSASPLSRQVRALEAHLGLALFARDRQRLQLTAAGSTFLADARDLLVRAERLERASRPAAATVTIGYVESALWGGVLPRAVATLRRASPGIRVVLRHLRTADQHAALDVGDIDIGFAHRPLRGQGRPVLDEPFVLAVPAGHRLARLSAVAAADLDGQPFVWPSGDGTFPASCRAAGFFPRAVADAAEPSAALALAQAGVGIALLQRSATSMKPPGVVFRPVPPGFKPRLRVHRVGRHVTPSHTPPA